MSRAEKFRWYEVRAVEFVPYVLLRFVVPAHTIFPHESVPAITRVLGVLINDLRLKKETDSPGRKRLFRLVELNRWIGQKHVRIAAKDLEKSPGICPADRIPSFIGKFHDRWKAAARTPTKALA